MLERGLSARALSGLRGALQGEEQLLPGGLRLTFLLDDDRVITEVIDCGAT